MSVILLVGSGLTAFWWQKVLPFKDIQSMGEIRFPEGTKIVDSNHKIWSVNGTFLLPRESLGEFIENNGLKSLAAELYSSIRCIHNGDNEVVIELNAATSIATIEVAGPDHSGSKVCNLQNTSIPSPEKAPF